MDILNSVIISVLISIVISWALFAMLCSFIHEGVMETKAERGRFLRKYIYRQLKDMPNQINWGRLLYINGSIRLLSRETGEPPASISSKLLAETLIDTVGNVQLIKIDNDGPEDPGTGYRYKYISPKLENFRIATKKLIASDVVKTFRQALEGAEQSVLKGKAKDDDPRSIIFDKECENTVYGKLVENLEKWFDEMGNQLSDWYKKKTRYRLFFLGFLLAAVINVDSVQLFKHFNASPESRKAMQAFYQENVQELSKKQNALLNSKFITGSAEAIARDSIRSEMRTYMDSIKSLSKAASLPVGIDKNVFNNLPGMSLKEFLFKLIGLLLSGLAASFGGPFWFDLLKKIYTKKI